MSQKFITDHRSHGNWLHGWDDFISDGWDTARVREASSRIHLTRGIPGDSLDVSPGRDVFMPFMYTNTIIVIEMDLSKTPILAKQDHL